MSTDTPAQPIYNPWRESLENCISGDNYLRSSEYHELIGELDELYRLRAASPQPTAAPVAELVEALRIFVGCALPVSTEIDKRGHRWTEAYLDQALPIGIAALERAALSRAPGAGMPKVRGEPGRSASARTRG